MPLFSENFSVIDSMSRKEWQHNIIIKYYICLGCIATKNEQGLSIKRYGNCLKLDLTLQYHIQITLIVVILLDTLIFYYFIFICQI